MVDTRRRIGIAALLVFGAGSLVQAQDAFEDPTTGLPPEVIEMELFEVLVVDPDVPVPRNGAILISGSELEAPIVQVTKREGATTMIFGGTITHVSSVFWAWTPTEPLALGQYDVRVASSVGIGSDAAITVIDELELEPPPVTSDPVAFWVASGRDFAVCNIWTGASVIAGRPFAITVAGTATVLTQLATEAPLALAHQFMFRAVRDEAEAGDAPFVPISRQVKAGPYEVQADEYCYGIEAIDLVTLTVHRYDQELGCAPHGGLQSFEERVADVPDDFLRRHNCISPPSGFEERWCMLNVQCLEFTDPVTLGATFCHTYRDICPDAQPMHAGASGMSATAGAGGMSGGTTSGMTGDNTGGTGASAGASDAPEGSNEEPDAQKPTHTGGCSLRRADDSTIGATLVLALGMLVARRRLKATRVTR